MAAIAWPVFPRPFQFNYCTIRSSFTIAASETDYTFQFNYCTIRSRIGKIDCCRWHRDFNSTIVRLGVSLTDRLLASYGFQFNYCTIRRASRIDNSLYKIDFNSTIVRLGACLNTRVYERDFEFQFNYCTIRRIQPPNSPTSTPISIQLLYD